MDKNKYLRVFTDCYLVDGDNGYLIYDLSRQKLLSISQTAYSILKEIDGKSIDSIISKFGNEIRASLKTRFKRFHFLIYRISCLPS